jgi:vacuolar-type H+-ATPase subunit I/STV1
MEKKQTKSELQTNIEEMQKKMEEMQKKMEEMRSKLEEMRSELEEQSKLEEKQKKLEAQKTTAMNFTNLRMRERTMEFMKLLSTDCIVFNVDTKEETTGEAKIIRYFRSNPPNFNEPFVSSPFINKDGTITIGLSKVLKTMEEQDFEKQPLLITKLTFSFEGDSELIKKITIVSGGWYSGHF